MVAFTYLSLPFCSLSWPALQLLEAGVPHHKGSLVGDASNTHVAQICNLLLVLAHGDAAVKAALARPGTLRALCSAMSRLPQRAQLKCLKCLKHLSCDPGMLEPLQVVPLTLQVDQRGRSLLVSHGLLLLGGLGCSLPTEQLGSAQWIILTGSCDARCCAKGALAEDGVPCAPGGGRYCGFAAVAGACAAARCAGRGAAHPVQSMQNQPSATGGRCRCRCCAIPRRARRTAAACRCSAGTAS